MKDNEKLENTARYSGKEIGDGKSKASYALIDSGAGQKLERFGDRMIARPSSLAIWKKRRPEEWRYAQATFDPDQGWRYSGKRFDDWQVTFGSTKIELRLQSNGQVGLFPDHLTYLDLLTSAYLRAPDTCKVLNLFAFTGFASVFLRQLGASVCHVDLSETAIGWAKRNFEINGYVNDSKIRLIADDALTFLKRERKRGNHYSLILCDPPSFGRISKAKSWKIEEIVSQVLEDLLAVLEPENSALFFSGHHSALGPEVLSNLISDFSRGSDSVSATGLFIPEELTEGKLIARKLPAGHLVTYLRGV